MQNFLINRSSSEVIRVRSNLMCVCVCVHISSFDNSTVNVGEMETAVLLIAECTVDVCVTGHCSEPQISQTESGPG